jgi:hypothetical protein
MINSGSVDLLREFSEACRSEFKSLRALTNFEKRRAAIQIVMVAITDP